MVNVQPARMRNATDARNSFNELLGEAERGIITHVVKSGRVVAHLVPANARIVDDTALLGLILTTIGENEATYAAEQIGSHGHAGDSMGRLLAWAWQTDRHVFSQSLAIFHSAVERAMAETLERPHLAAVLESALAVRLSDSEIRDVLDYLDTDEYWIDYYPAPPEPPGRRNRDPRTTVENVTVTKESGGSARGSAR